MDVCSCGRGLRVGVAAHTGTMQDGSRMGRERAGLRANHSGRRDRRQEAHGTAPVAAAAAVQLTVTHSSALWREQGVEDGAQQAGEGHSRPCQLHERIFLSFDGVHCNERP